MTTQETMEPYVFTPVQLEHSVGVTRQTARLIGGTLIQGLFKSTREGYERDEYNDLYTAILQTEAGPIEYESKKYGYNKISITYPKSADPLSPDLVNSIFGSESAEIHTVFDDMKDFKKVGDVSRLSGSFRLPETDEEGRHYFLAYDTPSIRYNNNSIIDTTAVLDSKLGNLSSNAVRSIGLNFNYIRQPEEEIAKPTPEIIDKLSDKFKQLAIAIADTLGGAFEISAPYEAGILLPNYEDRAKSIIAARLALHGYLVSQLERQPDKDTQPGFAVLKGRKKQSYGSDTIVAEEGLSTFWYSKSKQWRFTRGIKLNHPATVQDLDIALSK